MSLEVYDRLYDLVSDNLIAAGKPVIYDKSTLLKDVESTPQEVDVSKYLELPNEAFLQGIFVNTFKRLPDEREAAAWAKHYAMPQKEFQEAALRSLCRSSVVAINHIRFVNNPYFEQKRGLKYKVMGKLYGLTDKASLREFGKKLPMPIQKIIRKVFL